jgi:RNA polymerase sigma-70 factor (sigma-E family)
MMVADTQAVVEPARGRLGELYRRHAPDAARLAYLLTGNRALAEDLVQDAFVRMIGRFQDLRSPDSFQWYLRRTVVNLVNSHFRHAKVERTYEEREAGASGPTPGVDVDAREDMWHRLLELPERQRVVIVLRFYEDLTEAQIAELTEMPLGTVKSLMSRGLGRLRGQLIDEG